MNTKDQEHVVRLMLAFCEPYGVPLEPDLFTRIDVPEDWGVYVNDPANNQLFTSEDRLGVMVEDALRGVAALMQEYGSWEHFKCGVGIKAALRKNPKPKFMVHSYEDNGESLVAIRIGSAESTMEDRVQATANVWAYMDEEGHLQCIRVSVNLQEGGVLITSANLCDDKPNTIHF